MTTFHDAWESQPQEARRRFISQSLDQYLQHARRVPFYRDRLAAYRPGDEHPLAGVPVLTSAELRELLPPASLALIAGEPRGYNVFQSGGSTGRPKTTLFSHQELEGLKLPNARGFFGVGLSPQDRVANLFATGSLYMTFLHIHRALEDYGCLNFPLSNHTPVDFLHTVVRLFDINVLTGITSVVLGALRGMAERDPEGPRIEKIYYGGEHLYEADIRELRERFGTRVIAAPGYGTVDSWYLGYQCLECPRSVFHAHDDQCYLEVVDEETGRSCPAGQIGALYVTAFARRLTPIVRYRVGDRASWMPDECACGRTTPRFRLLGRADDTLRIGFDLVDYAFVQERVARIPGLSGAVQMEKSRELGRDRLILRVEACCCQSAARALESSVVEERPALRKAISEGTVLPLRVELVAPGSLPRNPRTGKLVRMVDVL